MRPSQYHYIKRMLVHGMYNRKRAKIAAKNRKKKLKILHKEEKRQRKLARKAWKKAQPKKTHSPTFYRNWAIIAAIVWLFGWMYSINEYRGLDIVLSLISGEILFALYPFYKFLKTREKEIPDLEFDKDVMLCPRCGAEIDAKCKFCTQCGFQIVRDFHFPPEDISVDNQSVMQAAPVERETEQEQEQEQEQDIMPDTEEKSTDDDKIIICPVCGTKNLKTYSFCIECGICLNNPENFRKCISHPVCTQNQEKSESQPKETTDNQIQNIVIENGDVYLASAALMAADRDSIGIGKIQREYKVGFNRAAHIMDQLYEIGIVGEENGTSPRKVLVDKEKCKEILKNATISECPVPSYEPKPTDVYAEFCTASCEFDPSQNFKYQNDEGNIRYNDKRFVQSNSSVDLPHKLDTFKINEAKKRILELYESVGIQIKIDSYSVLQAYLLFQIIPVGKTRIKAIQSLQKDIEVTLGMNSIINVMSKKGYVGLLLPLQYFLLI